MKKFVALLLVLVTLCGTTLSVSAAKTKWSGMVTTSQAYSSPIQLNNVKNKTRPNGRALFLVRRMGLEPTWLPTRPSNVRVCLFRHLRVWYFDILPQET